VILFAYLFPNLGAFTVPVIIYALLFASNGSVAAMRYNHTDVVSYWCLLSGVILFLMSDSLIALSKFGGWKGQWIDPGVILTYFIGQYCIVQGVCVHIDVVHLKKVHIQ